ncbi:MAG TPA: sugar transferase, partial [Paludibacteraceae bacterium]|nr:sugar transferase [Paludibacteraceae bacterium]
SRLYYDITKGRNRVFSTTEVLGRLYFCGFKIIKEKVLGDTYMVIAQREKQPEKQVKRKYGLFIKLPRISKNKKKFNVYKLRTMHPYSEFLQAYMYEKHHLQKGGKISNDIRVSTWGRFLRKYWLDEVPMLINLLKGDMKIVGVRPLSAHFFSLYSKELQDKRTQFKPGLLPPFYADMPKTLEEIQNSEMCYLNACEQKGVFRTDWVYFWRIIYNIIFKRARSK